ncbi:hypothetical protein AYO20_07291 [Fonsecaea nubica]|uniref:Uncharacterized protein n=1 Tax=Fonsecaea nubica TaxID=856822 RepID=A0A178CWX9_9EURO|nr:hypothetical protein AYO20_07291 [Fonsecaea nubica]OAL33435.1 hypothetical protein AYO20_07291 [Fonsecaea nubica]
MLGRQQATLIEAVHILHHRLRTGEATDDLGAQFMKEDSSVNDILHHLGLTPLEVYEADPEHGETGPQSTVSPVSSPTTTPASAEDRITQSQLEWGDYQVPLETPDKAAFVETPAMRSQDQPFSGVEPLTTDDPFSYDLWGNDSGLEAQSFLVPSPSPQDAFSEAQSDWNFSESCPLSYLAPAGKSGPHQNVRLVF